MGDLTIDMIAEWGCCFLDYRGRLRPLPSGWETWNSYRGETLVGSLALSRGTAESLDWREADYDGPFFLPAASDPTAVVARMECVYIKPALRGGELWQRYAALLARLGLPIYAAFANPRLGERFREVHQPRFTAERHAALPL
jgi:hypothetical protein